MLNNVRLLVFGFGYSGAALARRVTGESWGVSGVARSEARRAAMRAENVEPVESAGLVDALSQAKAILIAAPPDAEGCPGLRALGPLLKAIEARPRWIGYLSTTGVYGDRGGGWVFEGSALRAQSMEGARRVAAERDWLALGEASGLNVAVFRLPGIYGPPWRGADRSPFGRIRAGTARRIVKPGQVFSRIHVDDLAAGLHASLQRPRPGAIYNLCDDAPAPPDEVAAFAAKLIGIEPPPEEAFADVRLSPAQRRFYAESKRVSNARAKAELGWRPVFPSYREGLRAILNHPLSPSSSRTVAG